MTDDVKPAEWLAENKEWQSDESGRLVREYQFADFVSAFSFLYKVSVEAEKMNHHPDFSLYSWNRVRIILYTHSENAVTASDMKLASTIEQIFGRQ
ncbi:MAG: putative pterin-4-alpha-carbinolamine dehydratase [Ignavibacteriales bacterium]|jgi:4a-hydroxytetrahydrobiopterin dehydratase